MSEVRRYPRVRAMMRYRRAPDLPLGNSLDLSLGGVGVVSDQPLTVGEPLELELFFPDNTAVTVAAKVAWVEALPGSEGARYRAGVQFVAAGKLALEKIAEFVEELE